MRIGQGIDAGSAFFPKARQGYVASLIIVRDDATAEPPAHCRLVSGNDPKEDSGQVDYSARIR